MRKLALLIVCQIIAALSFGQGVVYNHSHVTQEIGLPGVSVRCLYKDSKGYIWIGVEEKGLFLYDGYNYTQYADSAGISLLTDSSVESIAEDRNGKLWLATPNGLNLFDKKSKTIKKFYHSKTDPNTINSNTCIQVKARKGNEIWLSTWDGVCRIDADTHQITRFLVGKKGATTISYDIWIDHNEQVWAATSKGVFRYDDQTQKMTAVNVDPERQTFTAFISSKNGNYWVASDQDIYTSADGESWQPVAQENFGANLGGNARFAFDANDNLWVYTYNHGITIIDPKTLVSKPFYSRTSIKRIDVRAMIPDDSGNIWLGTKFKGIYIFNPSSAVFPLFGYGETAETSIRDKYVVALAQDKSGKIYVGTKRGGLYEFDTTTKHFKSIILPKYLTNKKKVSKLLVTPTNKLWLMINHKMYCINKERTEIEFFEGIRETRDMVLDSHGKIWISTKRDGLKIIDTATKQISSISSDIALNNKKDQAYKLMFDKSGRLWLGTMGNGLVRIDTATLEVKRYRHTANDPTSINSNSVRALLQDTKGRIWVGMKNGGACMYNAEKDNFIRAIENHKQGKYSVFSMEEDREGNLWMGTFTGIVKFNPSENLHDLFSEEFGLQSDIFEIHAHCITNSDDLLFGGQAGFNLFSPGKVKKPGFEIPLVVNKILLHEEEMAEHLNSTRNFTLDYDENFLSFDFSLLDYFSPKGSKYSFKMEGVDEQWSKYSFRNFTTYTNLDAGEYTFQLRAMNRYGVAAKNQLSFNFTIHPPFWKTWWFYLIEIILAFSLIYGVVSMRLRIIKQQKEELERIVALRTQELSEANNDLHQKHEEVLQQNEEILTQKEILEERNKIIDKSYRDAEVFNKLGQSITSSLDYYNISATVHSHLKEIFELSGFGIGVIAKNHTLHFEYLYEFSEELDGYTISLNDENDLLAWSVTAEQDVRIMTSKGRDKQSQKLNLGWKHVPQSIIAIALKIKSKTSGLLLLTAEKENAFNASDYHNIQALGAYISIALDNANAYKVLERTNENTMASIKYAQRIQMTILPPVGHIESLFDTFLFFKPKDIVSGDFYWFVHTQAQGKQYTFAAVVDCTGHGVPGAFMSLIGNRMLSEIVLRTEITTPCDILEELDQRVRTALRTEEEGGTDGMDVCLCRLEKKTTKNGNSYEVVFSGAKRPLYVWNAKEQQLTIHKGTKRSINGRKRNAQSIPFEGTTLNLSKGDTLYLSSDGLADQPNNRRRPLGSAKLIEHLKKQASLEPTEQQNELEKLYRAHKQDAEQRDDITIFALRAKF